jgi:hypothetical protein
MATREETGGSALSPLGHRFGLLPQLPRGGGRTQGPVCSIVCNFSKAFKQLATSNQGKSLSHENTPLIASC